MHIDKIDNFFNRKKMRIFNVCYYHPVEKARNKIVNNLLFLVLSFNQVRKWVPQLNNGNKLHMQK